MAEDEKATWHHQLNGYETERTLGDSEGQRSLKGYSPWNCKELDMTEQLTHIFEQQEDQTSLSTREAPEEINPEY